MMCAASGAKDTVSFDVRLANEYLPSPSSITHEGCFYEHYFDVGKEDEHLFSCDWSTAATKDPISGKMEYYVGCGMRSKLDGEGIVKHGRPPVQLSIVLDISGSMSSPFTGKDEKKNKLDVAKDCTLALLDHLRPTDSFGLVTFDDRTEVIQEMRRVSSINMPSLKATVLNLQTRGSTDMEKGIHAGMDLLLNNTRKDEQLQIKRVMFLTDAQPSGNSEPEMLLRVCEKHSEQDRIFTTFVGLGVDFGVDLINSIAHVRGCSYFTVNSAKEFKKLMDQDFDYVVYPCCFDLEARIAAESAVKVDRVYGSPGNELPSNGVLLTMTSGFPSAKDENDGTKGGIILAKISPSSSSSSAPTKLALALKYADIEGRLYSTTHTLDIPFSETTEDYFSSPAIRKAILLTRFVNTMKWWILDHQHKKGAALGNTVSTSNGIPPAPKESAQSNASERCRTYPMQVSAHYKDVMARFLEYYERETERLADAGDADPQLAQHVQQMTGLADYVQPKDIAEAMKVASIDKNLADLNAELLQAACERALRAKDLSAHRDMFEREIKRLIKEKLVARMTTVGDKTLKASWTGTPEEKRAFLERELLDCVRGRSDQSMDEWVKIAEKEVNQKLNGPRPRQGFFVM